MRPVSLAFAAALGSAVSSSPVLAGANFDAFLSGLDHACKSAPAFETFWASISEHYGYSDGERPKVVLPTDLATVVGPIEAADRGEWVDVSMTLDGTFREMKLARLVFFVGKENGISGYRVEFAETPARLKAVLGPAVAKGKKQMATEYETGATTDFDFKKGAVAVFCDFSN
jgi:hypothetical protein